MKNILWSCTGVALVTWIIAFNLGAVAAEKRINKAIDEITSYSSEDLYDAFAPEEEIDNPFEEATAP